MNSNDWDDNMKLIISFLHKYSVSEDIYLVNIYSLINKRISHLYFINSLNRIIDFNKDEMIITTQQFDSNISYYYLNI